MEKKVVVFVVGIIVGFLFSMGLTAGVGYKWDFEITRHSCAEFNSTTGAFQWLDTKVDGE